MSSTEPVPATDGGIRQGDLVRASAGECEDGGSTGIGGRGCVDHAWRRECHRTREEVVVHVDGCVVGAPVVGDGATADKVGRILEGLKHSGEELGFNVGRQLRTDF